MSKHAPQLQSGLRATVPTRAGTGAGDIFGGRPLIRCQGNGKLSNFKKKTENLCTMSWIAWAYGRASMEAGGAAARE